MPKVYVAGHTGLVGASLSKLLRLSGYEVLEAARASLDLTDRRATEAFLLSERPDIVIDAAARVGGILDNAAYPADYIRDNLLIQTHLIHASWLAGVRQFLFLGSSCIYPRDAAQPLQPSSLMTGALEPTNRAYAMAKLAGIEMCLSYRQQYGFPVICVMPTNLYGPGDRFDPQRSHVIPGLISRISAAAEQGVKRISLFGTGRALREFLFVDDLAAAILRMLDGKSWSPIVNVGSGEEVSIADLAGLIAKVVGYEGRLSFELEGPDGTPRKLLDSTEIRESGWRPEVGLEDGLRLAWRWFKAEACSPHDRVMGHRP
jgi:GDP-L-fucose synthase